MRSPQHKLLVEIECQDGQTAKDAAARLARWIAHFGHTAPSFGFEFIDVKYTTEVERSAKED